MRKTLLSLAFLLTGAGAWAQTDDLAISTNAASPEKLFTMKNGNGYWMTSHTSPTSTKYNAAYFAFFAESWQENSYKVYCTSSGKWLTYSKADSYDNSIGFVSFVED